MDSGLVMMREKVCRNNSWDYKRQHNLDIKVEFFNTFGPRMQKNDGRVVSNFIVQALTNKDITVYGNGEQTRSFAMLMILLRAFLTMKKPIFWSVKSGNGRN